MAARRLRKQRCNEERARRGNIRPAASIGWAGSVRPATSGCASCWWLVPWRCSASPNLAANRQVPGYCNCWSAGRGKSRRPLWPTRARKEAGHITPAPPPRDLTSVTPLMLMLPRRRIPSQFGARKPNADTPDAQRRPLPEGKIPPEYPRPGWFRRARLHQKDQGPSNRSQSGEHRHKATGQT
jgi:hypothetical protein